MVIVFNTTGVHHLLHKGSTHSANSELPVQLNASFAEGDKVMFVVLGYYGNSIHRDYCKVKCFVPGLGQRLSVWALPYIH